MRFQTKVTLLLIATLAGFLALLAGLVYPRAIEEQKEALRRRVTSIAATGALRIDGDFHQSIPANSSAAGLPAYEELQGQLKQILAANPGIRYVWTMVKSGRAGETVFVGDVGGSTQSPGRRYDAAHIPDLWLGFEVPSADQGEIQDPWGLSISGYAPVRNADGEVVAILGVDVYDQQLYELRHRFQRFLWLSLAGALLVALLLGRILSGRIADPLNHLIQGMRQVEAGDLKPKVRLRTGDEFEQAAEAFNRMTEGLRRAREELRGAFLRTVQSLMGALEAKDPNTRGHSEAVTRWAVEIAKVLCKSEREIGMIQRLATLHDIGKIGIHDKTLQKPASLSEEEWRAMKLHPVTGAKILAPLELSDEELALIISHHEREDGTGYPAGLAHGQIPDLVAIVSVADAYDAMTSSRPYRPAMAPERALTELRQNAGTQFRPEVVEALVTVLQKQGIL